MSKKQKQTRVIRLFFSYSSEQRTVVSQVNDLLKDEYDVWFDKDKLTGGDSLFEKISEGLGWCEFGVVFLSKDYLDKGWTNAEFRGLWTKQIETHSKVILPIWHDVTFQEVYNFSPMVADLTAFPSQDPAETAKWIRSAVGVAEQSREVYNPLKKALMALQSDMTAGKLWQSWSHTEGVKAVFDEWENLPTIAERVLQENGNSTFSIKRGQNSFLRSISIEGPPLMSMAKKR